MRICQFLLALVPVLLLSACGQIDVNLRSLQNDFQVKSLSQEQLKVLANESQEEPLPSQITDAGFLKPTIYYYPVFDQKEKSCQSLKPMMDKDGLPLVYVCESFLKKCGIQGACSVIQEGVRRNFNILRRVDGIDQYFEFDLKKCPYGFGVRNSCLDPFRSLAADLSIYKPGDVIYIPTLHGVELPDGTIHDGYFVIRDRGRGIKGPGRFDFFSGDHSWWNTENPFFKLGLANQKNQMFYVKIEGPVADQVRKARNYPRLPKE